MNLINIIFGSLLALGSMFSPAKTQSLGAAVPSIQALFETSLQASVTSNATSATLVSGTDLAGNNIFGYYCFTIDAGTVQNEFVCGNASGTALTNLTRGVNPALGITSNVALEYAHRRGADVKMTDAPYLSIYSNIFNGQQGIPASMYYDAHPTSTASTTIEDKNYIDNSVTAGGVPATTGVPGISPLSTGAQMASGTATTTYNTLTYSYVPANSNFSSVAKGSYVGVVASGTLDPSFLLNGNYALGSLTSASTTLNGTTTASGTIILNGLALSADKFGGTGASGTLSLANATQTINLANATTVILNYASISLTGSSTLSFSNPNTHGTIIEMKSQGNVTISASSTINLTGLGGQSVSAQTVGNYGNSNFVVTPQGGGAAGGSAQGVAGIFIGSLSMTSGLNLTGAKYIPLMAGASGGGGFSSVSKSGAGALYIECAGALNFTGTINAAGTGAGGDGGSGGGGTVVILYNTLTANSGTINVAGGSVGSSGSYSGGGGAAIGGNGGPGGSGGGAGAAGFSQVIQNTEF